MQVEETSPHREVAPVARRDAEQEQKQLSLAGRCLEMVSSHTRTLFPAAGTEPEGRFDLFVLRAFAVPLWERWVAVSSGAVPPLQGGPAWWGDAWGDPQACRSQGLQEGLGWAPNTWGSPMLAVSGTGQEDMVGEGRMKVFFVSLLPDPAASGALCLKTDASPLICNCNSAFEFRNPSGMADFCKCRGAGRSSWWGDPSRMLRSRSQHVCWESCSADRHSSSFEASRSCEVIPLTFQQRNTGLHPSLYLEDFTALGKTRIS